MDLAVDLLFMADILRNFNTAFVTSDDVVVCDRHLVCRRYLAGWFVPDLVSSLPYRLMLTSMSDNPLFTQGETTANRKDHVKTVKPRYIGKPS